MTADSNPSFFSKLMERRFFQFLGSYLLGVWALVQFIDWIAVRFNFHKSWSETTLTFFALMIPTAILIIYFHGKAGTQKWSKLEKIVIPINLIIALLLTVTFYFNRNIDEMLSNTAGKITLFDENGNEVQRFVPQSSNTRRIVMFPFVNKNKKASDQWQSIGLSKLLATDLEQDNRLFAVNPLRLNDDFIDYGYDINKETPFAILRKIADDYYSDFFFTGSYEINDGTYKVHVEAFSSVDGKSFFNGEKEGTDFFTLIDDLSQDFNKNLSLPDTEKDIPLVDLPSSNLFSHNPDAFKDYIHGITVNTLKNDPKAAIANLQNAIKQDPNCVECYSYLGQLHFRVNDLPKALSYYENAIKRVDALPERQQLDIKYWNYFAHSQVEKTIALTKMWMQFYPNDYKPYAYLINNYQRRMEVGKAKDVAKKALNVGHKGTIFTTLAKIALLQDDLPEAKKYYQKFQEAYPHRAKETTDLADIYIKEGDYDKARAHLKNLQLLNSNDESIISKLAKVEYNAGNPVKAIEYLNEALSNCSNTKDSVTMMSHLEGYHTILGEINKAIELKEQRMQLQLSYSSLSEVEYEFLQFQVIDQYIKAGKRTEIEAKLTPFMEPNPSFPNISCSARINYYLAIRDVENANKYEKDCRQTAIQSQGATSYLIVDAFMAELNGDYANAVKLFEQFKKATNFNAVFLEGFMVRFYRLNKQTVECKKLALEQISTHPLTPNIHYELALNYEQEGNRKEAIVIMEKALEIWKDADENFVPAQKAKAELARLKNL